MDIAHNRPIANSKADSYSSITFLCLTLATLLFLGALLQAQEFDASGRRPIAVLDLTPQNVTEGEAALITELLKDELLRTDRYSIVEKQRLDEIIEEQSFQHFGLTDTERAVELGKILNIQTIFIGTLGQIQGKRLLAVRQVDVTTGAIVASTIERDFVPRDAAVAVRRLVLKMHGIAPDEATLVINTEARSDIGRYLMVYTGWSAGSLLNYAVESVFNGPIEGESAWSGEAAEVKSNARLPQIGLRLGAWKRWFGGDIEVSLISHVTPGQDVYYDMAGYVRQNGEWHQVYLDTLTLPAQFQKMSALGFGGNTYVHIPSKLVQPYFGIGASLLMNRVTSDHPGPGNIAMGLDGVPLNSTSLGWAIQFPIGIKVPLSNRRFVYAEFRPARHHFSIVSGDGFQKERDAFTLQSFQMVFGYGLIYQ